MIVSLGIIALNEEKYLPSVLDDILQQTYPICQIDLILIDSISDDSTKSIMESFKNDYLDCFTDFNYRILYARLRGFIYFEHLANDSQILKC